MNFRLALATAFLFNSCIVVAQHNLQAGYIVLSAGDTLKGLVDYKEWHRNPVTISFTSTAEHPLKIYSNKDIKYFEVTGKASYYLYKVRISMDTRVLAYVPEKKDTTNRVEAVFLRVVHVGTHLSLFSYSDESKLRWYVKETTKSTPEELLNSVYRNRSSIMNEREYRSQLAKLSGTYSPFDKETSALIERASYTKKTILSICRRINGSTADQTPDGIWTESLSPFRFFAGAGGSLASISFSGSSRYSGQTSTSLSPLFGGGLDVHIVPDVGRLYLRNTLTYTTLKSEFRADQTSLELKQLSFSIHCQLNYNFYNRPDFKWFAGSGAGLNISSYPINTQIGEYGTVTEDFLQTEKFWINMTIQSGVSVKNIEISLSYFLKSDITSYRGFAARNSSFQLRMNYLFKRKIRQS